MDDKQPKKQNNKTGRLLLMAVLAIVVIYAGSRFTNSSPQPLSSAPAATAQSVSGGLTLLTEPPAERKYLDYNQVVSNLIGYGQSLGMVYNGSLGIGNAGWFPPTDISGYTDTDAATAACYSDVDYVPYYYADLGAVPSDIMFNVVASGGQIYVVYG